jgi:hypothetical protein
MVATFPRFECAPNLLVNVILIVTIIRKYLTFTTFRMIVAFLMGFPSILAKKHEHILRVHCVYFKISFLTSV